MTTLGRSGSLLADLNLPPAAYRALLKFRARSEAGGRIAMHQATPGELLGLSRPSVNAALWELELELVKKVRNGVYQVNPMLAGYNSPEDALDAVKAMPKADPAGQQDLRGGLQPGHRRLSGPTRRAAQEAPGCRRCQEGHGRQEAGSLHAVG
ncbi:hypothetical protein EES37_34685 [Streptomyces sp. ADI91-18]|uniref:MarR family transcriptional regulator n=1 Tax=Streptomyces sp. ADI91-18 TaxID=1522755 RepID=UPI000FA07CA3|nr:MarR family transcriptional regulator [Streptomyces sp. ADI91-18]RPK31881.1 hypothetical protein EES37_34685 [Streptomyces sp. ADI91-18]